MSTLEVSTALVAQARFRALLNALARPGLPMSLGQPAVAPRGAAFAYLLGVAETLLDHEVGFAAIGSEAGGPAITTFLEEVRLRTGASSVSAARARFVFVFGAGGPALRGLAVGTPEYPDESATLLWHVPVGAPRLQVVLAGPGVDQERHCELPGIVAADIAVLGEINAAYPLGLDLFLVGEEGNAVGLPRSVRVRLLG